MIYNTTEAVIREYMDYSDRATVRAIAEAGDQNQILAALTSALYDKIVSKANKIDYSSISRSRGDITKIEKYDQLMECLEIIQKLVAEYKQNTEPVDAVSSAMANLKSRVAIFKKAFVINSPIPVMMYNNIALACVNSVSFLIATCIEFIKDPASNSFQMALDTVAYGKTMDNILFESLSKFNEGCSNGDLDTAFKGCMSIRMTKEAAAQLPVNQDSPFLSVDDINDPDTEVVLDDCEKERIHESIGSLISMVPRMLLLVIKLPLTILRSLVYFYYHTRQSISDFWNEQANLLYMNAYMLQYNDTIDPKKRQEIYNKQMKIVEKWRKMANKWNIDYTSTKNDAVKDIQSDDKKYRIDEIPYDADTYDNNSIF